MVFGMEDIIPRSVVVCALGDKHMGARWDIVPAGNSNQLP